MDGIFCSILRNRLSKNKLLAVFVVDTDEKELLTPLEK
jgi:hypothetical protein